MCNFCDEHHCYSARYLVGSPRISRSHLEHESMPNHTNYPNINNQHTNNQQITKVFLDDGSRTRVRKLSPQGDCSYTCDCLNDDIHINDDDAKCLVSPRLVSMAPGQTERTVECEFSDFIWGDLLVRYVEEFFESWIVMLQQQQDKVTTQDGGSRAPALTYNDDTELMVRAWVNIHA